MVRLAAGAALLLAALLPTSASAHNTAPPPASARMASVGSPCPGTPIAPDRVITGSFTPAQQGSYVLVPFDVPARTSAVRVKYCYDQPEAPTSSSLHHTLDLGLYEPKQSGNAFPGEKEFRGWGGSSHPDVVVSNQGFSSEAQYLAAPKTPIPGRTTRGFIPGPIRPGTWSAELGVAAVVSQAEGDTDGQVQWRIELSYDTDPAYRADPYHPAVYDSKPARSEPGWYSGDMHVHAEHSALGDATDREVFDYAFKPVAEGGAGLDFVTLTDYVTSSGWGEIGRYQSSYPGKLIARSAEIITYRGHTNNQVSVKYVDYRTGPIYERRSDGTLVQRRGPRPPSEIFKEVHAAGGFTQVNHPTIFPSETPGFANLCRGCPWDYSDAETQWQLVDAYEVTTGPPGFPIASGGFGPNPFTLAAIDEYDRLRRDGFRIAAVGVSDSHKAGRTDNPFTQAPLGVGRTVVYAPALSEDGIRAGVLGGHTYVKVFGAASPDLRLQLRNANGSAIIGGSLPGNQATLVADVSGGAATTQARTLQVRRDGMVIATVPITALPFHHEMTVTGPGDYRIQVMRGTAPDSLTTPITLRGSGAARR